LWLDAAGDSDNPEDDEEDDDEDDDDEDDDDEDEFARWEYAGGISPLSTDWRVVA
jgi:hypothetical protein